MADLKLSLILFLGLLLTSHCWDYGAQENWPSTCSQSSYQSPINIPNINNLSESEIRLILEYSWATSFGAPRMLDNGHYLIVRLSGNLNNS